LLEVSPFTLISAQKQPSWLMNYAAPAPLRSRIRSEMKQPEMAGKAGEEADELHVYSRTLVAFNSNNLSPKLVSFTIKTRQSGVWDGHQSGACAITRG